MPVIFSSRGEEITFPENYWYRAVGGYFGGWAIIPIYLLILGIQFTPSKFFWENPPIISSSIILLVFGAIYFSKYLIFLWIVRTSWESSQGGDGDGGPKRPILATIFLISLSVFIFAILVRFFHVTKFPDMVTVWSAVYGSILGTVGFLGMK